MDDQKANPTDPKAKSADFSDQRKRSPDAERIEKKSPEDSIAVAEQQVKGEGHTDTRDQKIEELTALLARALADLQNFKRRSEEDRNRFVKFANLEMLKSLLPVLNNLERSAHHLPEELKENEWAKGVMGVHSDMKKTLGKMGVQKVETMGQILNPQFHEALMSGPGEKDKVIEEYEAGYTYHGEVIWPAKVKVGDGT